MILRRKNKLAQEAVSDSMQVVTFCLVNQTNNKREDYAIPIEQVKEIRTLEEITKVPKAKSFVRGIMNLRGLIIPVIDVKDKLGFGSTDLSNKSKQRILVAEVKDSLYGLLVDDVDQVMRIPTKDIGPAPPGAFEALNYVKGIVKTSENLIVLLDVLPLINEEQIESKELTNNSQIESKIEQIQPQKMEKPEQSPIVELPKEEEVDDIPPELKAVFDEDENGVAPTEIKREENPDDVNVSSDMTEDFQTLVDNETQSQ